MSNLLPAAIEQRRHIENIALDLARQRHDANELLAHNTWDIIELLRDPQHGVVPLEQLASLLGVSRQSLYRWREIGQKIPADLTVAQAMTMVGEDGSAIYYFG